MYDHYKISKTLFNHVDAFDDAPTTGTPKQIIAPHRFVHLFLLFLNR